MPTSSIKRRILNVAIVALAFMPTSGSAQDLPTDQLQNHGQVVRDNAILRHNLDYARRSNGGRSSVRADPTPRKAAICAQRPRYAREYGADHPKVRQLNALCERDGY